MTLVREDKYGVFVKVDGSIARPQVNRWNSPERRDTSTRFKMGDRVKARHIPQTTLAKVGGETWFLHGEYAKWDPGRRKMIPIPSEECFG